MHKYCSIFFSCCSKNRKQNKNLLTLILTKKCVMFPLISRMDCDSLVDNLINKDVI